MKRTGILGLVVAGTILVAATLSVSRADNPVVQTCFTADPAPMVYKDTLYLITSHDEDDARGFRMLDWKCYSTKDMANWTDHGTIASLATFKWAVQSNDAWAPQAIERDGKFYLYVPISVQGWPKNVIAVAVADNILGPYKDPLGHPLISKGNGYIDPTVFIDDDGQAYLYFGHTDAWYVKLNKDMISYSGGIVKAAGRPKNYQEGPWFYKRNGHYYMAYASTCCPEGIGYAMSDSPTGPWQYKGMIMDPNRLSDGNHPGIVDYQGKSYVFGFNYQLNFELSRVKRERRSVCAEVMNYNPDGTIQKHPWWSKEGAPQVGSFNPYAVVEAATICYEKGVKTKPRGDKPGVYVSANDSGGYIKVKGVDFGKRGADSCTASVANGAQPSTIELRLDDLKGTLIGSLAVPNTGNWETFTRVTAGINSDRCAGTHDLYFVFNGTNQGHLLNMDDWFFERNEGGK